MVLCLPRLMDEAWARRRPQEYRQAAPAIRLISGNFVDCRVHVGAVRGD